METSPHGNSDPADELFLNKLNQTVEENHSDEQFGVTQLARKLGISRSSLHRRLRSLTNKTVSQYIRDFRMKKALGLLNQSSLTVSEIAFKVGFGSVTYFNKCFQDFFGKTPTEARHQGLTWSEALPAEAHEALTGEESRNPSSRKVLFGSLWVVLLILTGWSLSKLFEDDAVKGNTITVLPIRDDSSDQENSYILQGLREEILNNLKAFSTMEVVSIIASQNYECDETKVCPGDWP